MASCLTPRGMIQKLRSSCGGLSSARTSVKQLMVYQRLHFDSVNWGYTENTAAKHQPDIE